MNPDVVRLFVIGPAVVVVLAAFLAVTALLAGAWGRLEPLAARGTQAVRRLSVGRFPLMLWGLAAVLLSLLGAAVLVNVKPLALLGVALFAGGMTLAGMGLGVSAVRVGRRLTAVLGHPHPSPLVHLALGMGALCLAACVPILGWLVVLAAVFAGVGAVLDTLLRRPVP